ncbi:Gfo/Idh/MocA family protein [Mucilaginibacter pedocola]|uniref:Oxidoreductase n=1 Tax=Mucilaginibacter pedocola TaxID=1792845 RepID=A0A1S9PAE6_9SPHI|nr:Gfo/Idh/MocA family oxidoreductase [Mucilaginibacter pedocola]OOQ57940.1 oxidoreductase [Mucilaginibacter pedocola]
MESQKIKWGIIGCGDVTELKSGQAYNKINDSSLVAVMRRNAEKAADYARRHNVPKWYSDAELLLSDEEVNSVSIATPPSSHLDYAKRAIAKGLNVYVEKPVTRNAAEAEAMAEAVRESGAKLVVAHYRRGLPMFLHVKSLLESGAIGEVRTAQIRMWQNRVPKVPTYPGTNWRLDPEVSGGGYFHDLAPHQLDLMLFFFGEPAAYSGYSLNQANISPADDHVCGSIVFKNNIVVNGTWSFNVAESETIDSCEIVGTKGKITFPFFGKFVTLKNEAGEETIEFTHPMHIQQPMIEKIVAFFKDEGPNPCTIDEAVVLMKIMDSFTLK